MFAALTLSIAAITTTVQVEPCCATVRCLQPRAAVLLAAPAPPPVCQPAYQPVCIQPPPPVCVQPVQLQAVNGFRWGLFKRRLKPVQFFLPVAPAAPQQCAPAEQ